MTKHMRLLLIRFSTLSFILLLNYSICAQSKKVSKINHLGIKYDDIFSKSNGTLFFIPNVDFLKEEIKCFEVDLNSNKRFKRKKHKLSVNDLTEVTSLCATPDHLILLGSIETQVDIVQAFNIYRKDISGKYQFQESKKLSEAINSTVRKIDDSTVVFIDFYYARSTNYPQSNLKLYYLSINSGDIIDTLYTKFSNSSFSSVYPQHYFEVVNNRLLLMDPANGTIYEHELYSDSLNLKRNLNGLESNVLNEKQLASLNLSAMTKGVMNTYSSLRTYLAKDSLYYLRSFYQFGDLTIVEKNDGNKPSFSDEKFKIYKGDFEVGKSENFSKILDPENYRYYYIDYEDDSIFIIQEFAINDEIFGRKVKKKKCYFISCPLSELYQSEN